MRRWRSALSSLIGDINVVFGRDRNGSDCGRRWNRPQVRRDENRGNSGPECFCPGPSCSAPRPVPSLFQIPCPRFPSRPRRPPPLPLDLRPLAPSPKVVAQAPPAPAPRPVEEWRTLVAAYFAPSDVDKALAVISCESGVTPTPRTRAPAPPVCSSTFLVTGRSGRRRLVCPVPPSLTRWPTCPPPPIWSIRWVGRPGPPPPPAGKDFTRSPPINTLWGGIPHWSSAIEPPEPTAGLGKWVAAGLALIAASIVVASQVARDQPSPNLITSVPTVTRPASSGFRSWRRRDPDAVERGGGQPQPRPFPSRTAGSQSVGDEPASWPHLVCHRTARVRARCGP